MGLAYLAIAATLAFLLSARLVRQGEGRQFVACFCFSMMWPLIFVIWIYELVQDRRERRRAARD